ncbi:MAG: DNA polymerase III subunit beta, partial [Gammaproteobacteria bacterium]|nr:DNA polymerase III subunit beta [Gammaproteobacteria bacterium]
MRLTLEQPQLANLINSPTSVVEAKNTIPILGHIKVTATDDTVSAMATDLDIEAVTISAMHVDEPGEFTVPAKPFDA